MHLDQVGWRAVRRRERGKRVVLPCQRRTQPRGIKLRGHEVAFQVSELGPAYGWIKLDEHVAGADALTVANLDCPDNAGLEGLDGLGAAAWNDFSGRHGDNIDGADACPDERKSKHRHDR